MVYQARLLKAASYGKLFLEEFDHDFFTKTCKEIRVLNSIRYFRIGIPLTIEEYNKLGDHALVERLTHRNLHLLALRVCEYLKLSPNSVLIHWASSKLESSTSLSDESLAKTIVSKLEMYPGISYAEIATSAFRSGRLKLATLLLEKEPRAADQVRLLMSMKSNETALDKAMESLDTDLIFLVILGTLLRDEKELFRMLEHNSIATNLFISYCTASQKSEDHAVLKRFFFYLNRPAEAADHKILEGYKQQRFSDRTKFLELAKQFYEEEKQDEFAAKCVEEQIALLDIQRSREVKVDPSLVNAIAVENKRSAKAIFMDLSVSQMIEQYLVTDRQKDAEKLAKQFKVPVKRYTHIQVKAFSKSRKWEDLFRIFKGTKSPIGIIVSFEFNHVSMEAFFLLFCRPSLLLMRV